MPITRFEELRVWQQARAFNRDVYLMTRAPAFARDFAMSDQARRASLSVMNNIAEGFERFRRAEFMQFLSVAKGSSGEVRSMLYAALDVGYLKAPVFDEMLAKAEDLGRSIGTFRTGLERSAPRPTSRK